MIAVVKWEIGSGEGTITVNCDPDDDQEVVIGKAKRLLRQRGGVGVAMGFERWTVLRREE